MADPFEFDDDMDKLLTQNFKSVRKFAVVAIGFAVIALCAAGYVIAHFLAKVW